MSDEQAKRVFREVQALARADYGGNTGALLVVYGVEGFLRRLAASEYASRMTLKGGMLMAAISARRLGGDHDERAAVELAFQTVTTGSALSRAAGGGSGSTATANRTDLGRG